MDVIPPKTKFRYKRRTREPGQLDPSVNPHVLDQIALCGSYRHTIEETAAILGCSRSLLAKCFSKFPELREAWEDGRAHCKASIRRMLFVHAQDDPATARYLANNLLGLTNDPAKNKAVQQIGSEGGRLSPEEVVKRIRELQFRRNGGTPDPALTDDS